MIQIRALGDEVGVGITENGNAGITALDKKANTLVTIEIDAATWPKFVEAAGRLRGVGIAVPAGGLQVVELPGQGGNGSGG